MVKSVALWSYRNTSRALGNVSLSLSSLLQIQSQLIPAANVAALSIYAIQRCAMPFTGENMKTLLCCTRRAFRVTLASPALPPSLPRRHSPATFSPLFSHLGSFAHSDICLSYVFTLRISCRAFPDEGFPVSFTLSRPSRRTTPRRVGDGDCESRAFALTRLSGRK